MKNLYKDLANMHAGGNMSEQCTTGPISSISSDGKIVNVQTFSTGESRSNYNMTPYGISSGPKKGMLAQVIINDNDNTTVVGVQDSGKPDAAPGEVILYAAGGQKIDLKPDGSIIITGGQTTITCSQMNVTCSQMNVDSQVAVNGGMTVNGVKVGG